MIRSRCKTWSTLFALVVLTIATNNCQVYALDGFGPSCNLALHAVALYWRPFGADVLIGTVSELIDPADPSRSITQRKYLAFESQWGARVGAHCLFGCCCNRITASFLWVEGVEPFSLRVDQPGEALFSQFLTFSGAADLQARLGFKYYAADLLAGREFVCADTFHLMGFGGVRWLRLQRRGHSFGKQLSNTIATSAAEAAQHFSGAGPLIGLEGTYRICGRLQAFVLGAAGAAIGRERASRTLVSETQLVPGLPVVTIRNFASQQLTFFVPLVEGRLGLTYCVCIGRCPLTLRATYDYRIHFDIFRGTSFGGLATEPRRTITLGGLTLGGTIVF